jgi:hypothetical protein
LAEQRHRCATQARASSSHARLPAPHAEGVAHLGCADLEQLGADGGRAGLGKLCALQAQATQVDHQRVGQYRQQPPQLIGLESVATRAPPEQIQLRLLDAILGLPASAVPSLVQRLSRARRHCHAVHHEPWRAQQAQRHAGQGVGGLVGCRGVGSGQSFTLRETPPC